jgi:uncharacterized protein YjlB
MKMITMSIGKDDGHRRITKSEDFVVLGGDKDSHEKAVEVSSKTMETIHKEGKITKEKFREILENCI